MTLQVNEIDELSTAQPRHGQFWTGVHLKSVFSTNVKIIIKNHNFLTVDSNSKKFYLK